MQGKKQIWIDSLFILFTFLWGGGVVSEFLKLHARVHVCLCTIWFFLYIFFFLKHYFITESLINLNYRTGRKAAVFVIQHISQNQVFWILAGRRLSQSVTSKFLIGTGSIWSTKTYMSLIYNNVYTYLIIIT